MLKNKNNINNLIAEEQAVSAELNQEKLIVNNEPADGAELEKIIKTTDSMNIIAAMGDGSISGRKQSKSELTNIKEAIYRSFDLARRKITNEYEQIIASGNFVDNPFLAIQITLKNYEKKWNVQMVESIIKKFTDAIPEQLALGKTVFLSEDLTIEPITYVDKILPSWKITPDFALLTNGVKWDDIVNKLIQDGELTHDSKEIVQEAIEAIVINAKNGYYVKLSRLILLQLHYGVNQKIVLFSNDTLQKMNEIYLRFIKTGEKKQINKYDSLAHFERTRENVEKGYYNKDVEDASKPESEFIPRDLVEEIPQGNKSASWEETAGGIPTEEIVNAANASENAIEGSIEGVVEGDIDGNAKENAVANENADQVVASEQVTAEQPEDEKPKKRGWKLKGKDKDAVDFDNLSAPQEAPKTEVVAEEVIESKVDDSAKKEIDEEADWIASQASQLDDEKKKKK